MKRYAFKCREIYVCLDLTHMLVIQQIKIYYMHAYNRVQWDVGVIS